MYYYVTGLLLIVLAMIGIALTVAFYFLPSIIAIKKKHANKLFIFILNLAFGWTFLAWVACLIWAFVDVDGSATDNLLNGNKYDNLEKLQKLKESGALSEEEFEAEKQKILK